MPHRGTWRNLTLDLSKAHVALNREELRAQARIPAYHFARIRSLAVPGSAYELAPVWEISATGISLLLNRPCDRGELLDVQFRHLSVRDRVAMVVHATAKEASWLIGCALDLPLSANELQALAD